MIGCFLVNHVINEFIIIQVPKLKQADKHKKEAVRILSKQRECWDTLYKKIRKNQHLFKKKIIKYVPT